MRRAAAIVLCALCLFAAASGEGISGQHIDTFIEYYKESLDFINDNDGRHLLPLIISTAASDKEDGKMHYEIPGDVLHLSLRTDASGEVVERCEITLTAPQNLQHGSAEYRDFATSGYHSYALLMAMDAHADAAERYELVTDVNEGMADDGVYAVQLGVYALKCTRENGTARLLFEHIQARGTPEPTPEPTPIPEADDGMDHG